MRKETEVTQRGGVLDHGQFAVGKANTHWTVNVLVQVNSFIIIADMLCLVLDCCASAVCFWLIMFS